MIEFLRGWITNIAVVMIFIALLDILLPNGDMKRYTKVISGLIIILVIIKPFITLKDIDFRFKMSIAETTAYLDENVNYDGEQMGEYHKKQALDLFQDNIISQLKTAISTSSSINRDEIDIKLNIVDDPAKENYGEIESIAISIRQGSNSAISVSKVQSVNISSDKNVIKENNAEYNLNDSNLCKEIKASVHNYIGISEECIIVQME